MTFARAQNVNLCGHNCSLCHSRLPWLYGLRTIGHVLRLSVLEIKNDFGKTVSF
jgi:hypothetical protein